MNSDIIREVIDDHVANHQPSFIRDLKLHFVPKKALVVTGVRRCGKSTLCSSFALENISKTNLAIVNFSDDRLLDMQIQDMALIPKVLEARIQNDEPRFYVLDEIQLISGWEVFVDRLLRNPKNRVLVTGSSAKLLSQEIATELRGRSLNFELFPLSFAEFLRSQNDSLDISNRSLAQQVFFQRELDRYQSMGGFPELVFFQHPYAHEILQNYWHSMIYRDVIERHELQPVVAVRQLCNLLANLMGSMFSINKLFEKMKNLGFKIQKDFVSTIVYALEDAFVIFTTRIFSDSENVRNTNPKKLYLVDTGLANHIIHNRFENKGRILENLIFLHLRRLCPTIDYYKTKSGFEIDFILAKNDSQNITGSVLVQVCVSLSSEETRQREIRALKEAMSELKVGFAYIVTQEQKEEIRFKEGTIIILPAWEFCLKNLEGVCNFEDI